MDQSAQVPKQNGDGFVTCEDPSKPPSELVCPMCFLLYEDAVMAPCCKITLCEDCSEEYWLRSNSSKCPNNKCSSTIYDNSDYQPNMDIQVATDRWKWSRRNVPDTSESHSRNLADSIGYFSQQQRDRDTEQIDWSFLSSFNSSFHFKLFGTAQPKNDITERGRSLKRAHDKNDDSENIRKKNLRLSGTTNPVDNKNLEASQSQNKIHEDEKEDMELDTNDQ